MIQVDGLDRALVDIREYVSEAQKRVRDATNTTAINIQRNAKKNVRSFGTKIETRGGRTGDRRILIDTGLMSSSIHIGFEQNLTDLEQFSREGDERADRSRARSRASSKDRSTFAMAKTNAKQAASVGVGVHYAKYHELGLGVPKRAFLLPAAERERPAHKRRMAEAMRKR